MCSTNHPPPFSLSNRQQAGLWPSALDQTGRGVEDPHGHAHRRDATRRGGHSRRARRASTDRAGLTQGPT